MMNVWSTIALILSLSNLLLAARDWRVQRLNKFQGKYNDSRSDIIFLLDVSGSVSNSAFHTEKQFIKSLLNKISLQPIASRVAVSTFGKLIKKEIDYIDYGYLDKDKCTFTKEFAAKVKHRYGRATNMNGALKQAIEILKSAKKNDNLRENVNTAVFLITDGGWNYGGSPYSSARSLRNRNYYDAEIFSVGVGSVSSYQLTQIAGSKDNVIIAKDFSEFDELATRIRGDAVEILYKGVDSTKCGVKCDPIAECTCGTISGIYTCACPPGYYGSGLPGRCYKCLVGTYKTYASPDPCKKCPLKATTKKLGSTSIDDCVCLPGYEGYPHLGNPCYPLQCPQLPTSIENGKMLSCGNFFNQSCSYACDTNYHVANEAVTSRKLTCQLDGKWTQAVPTCVQTKCQWPTNPPHMELSCDSNDIGGKCFYTCKPGYTLVGAKERECRSDGQWSHSLPNCEVISCPPLRTIDNVNINPVKCLKEPTNYNDGCAQSCKPGFRYVSGNQRRVCQADGTWSGIELDCRDLTPPTIHCPEDVIAETEFGQAFKEISFDKPVVIDNSITGRDDITILKEPLYIESPYEFPIGVTILNFTAVDASNNADSCIFRVEIKDIETPKFSYCPDDIPLTTANTGEVSKEVKWSEPTFYDNSGKVKLVYSSHSNPSTFAVGPSYLVHYIIEDESKNKANCEFIVKIDQKKCPVQEAPINGAVTCTFAGVAFCQVSCQNPYTFNGPHANYYMCTATGQWRAFPPKLSPKWPDCTALQPKKGMGQRMRFFYFSGSCHEMDSTRKQITDSFMKVLNLILRRSGGCNSAANARVCQSENVRIKCGKVQTVSDGRGKRSTQNSFTLDVDVEVLSKEDDNTQKKVVKNLANDVRKIAKKSDSLAQQIKVIDIDGDKLLLDRVEEIGLVTGVCLDGSVYETVKKVVKNNVKEEQTCVSCLAGKYFDLSDRRCVNCPRGSYTEYPGRLGCTRCSAGKTTFQEGTSNRTHCKAPCQPGFYSKTGLEKCKACKRGFYQPNVLSTECLKCPGSTTTLQDGSTKQEECGMVCPPGTFSKTGVEPCQPCSEGFYQNGHGSKQCIRCPDEKSTLAIGATQELDCKKIDNCASNPCGLKDIQCVSTFNNYTCICPPGWHGRNCEVERNECSENPCYGNAVCVDQINGFSCVCPENYFGRYCEKKKPFCDATVCTNGGTCQETVGGHACACKAGFIGKFCERTIDECSSSPCLNSGICVDSHRGFKCICKPGFTGPVCGENIDDCEKNHLCLNGGECQDGIDNYTCVCKDGFEGSRCQVNKDECASNPCRNGARCIDGDNSFKCVCQPTFYGKTCEQRNVKDDFDLTFDRTIQSYAESTIHERLSEFTVSFWVKVSSDDLESGTVLSYAVEEEGSVIDNAIVLRDANSLTMEVLGEEVSLKIDVADNKWHHVAVTWSSSQGQYKAFRDGLAITSNVDFQKGRAISDGGTLFLGQEQDEIGRNFSASEAFDGSLSQFNMWNKVLSVDEIKDLSSYRCNHVLGNLLAWPDFYASSTDNVKRTNNFCRVKSKFSSWGSNSPCRGHEISAQCAATLDNKDLNQLNLVAECSKDGFKCSNADQTKIDPDNKITCPQMKLRYECPLTSRKYCSQASCSGHGSCIDLANGFKCLCNDGYHGYQCQNELPCHQLSTLTNGLVKYTSKNTAEFQCNAGYKLMGAKQIQCSKGKYNHPIPVCKDIDECSIDNGKCPHICVNLIGSFKCACRKGFEWSPSKRSCENINECAISNGNCQDKCMDNYGSYRCFCRNGFKISVDGRSCEDVNECLTNTHTCQQDCINVKGGYKCRCRPGYYATDDQKSVCQRRRCKILRAPRYGSISKGFGEYGTIVSYKCNARYRLKGSSERVCLANGEWSGIEPVCEAVQCITLTSPFNGKATLHGTGEGSYYKFSCLKEYILIGDNKRVCQNNGSWSGKQPRCVRSVCPPIPSPMNGQCIGSSFTVGATIIIKCNLGFMLSSKKDNYKTCQSNGRWSGKLPTCIKVSCGRPASLENGAVTGTSSNYNDVIRYKCDEGYGLSGPPARTCQLNGEWSGIAPKCLWNQCGYPGVPSNGVLSGDDFSFGKTVTYSCKVGFKLVGNKMLRCQSSGKWNGATPICKEITCGQPKNILNGEIHFTSINYKSVLSYDCLPGYSLRGARSRVCQENGKWTEVEPSCQAGICGSSKLVGPKGVIVSPNHPNSYNNNEYCRWKIVMPINKKASINIKSLKTVDISDHLEIYDGVSNQLLSALSGFMKNPIRLTSNSNILDVRFVTDGKDVADGFLGEYDGTVCGGHITSLKETIISPHYPSNYDAGTSCSWQIYIPEQKFIVKFERFTTYDDHDKLEVWKSITSLSPQTKVGTYYGNYGSLLEIKAYETLYLKFTSDSQFEAKGFKATLIKDKTVTV